MSITSALFLSVITLALISAFLFIQHEINALKNQFGVDVPSSKSSLNRKIPKTSKQESKANPESGVYLYSEENEVKLLEEDDYGEKRKSNFRAAPNIFTVNARPGKITSDVEEAVEEDDYSKRETKFVQADSKVSETSHLAMAKSEGDITSPNSSPNIEGAHDIKNQIAISLKNKTVVEIEMLELINKLKTSVRAMRWAKTVMSRNETAILQTTRLQNVTRCFLLSRYGPGPYFVEMTLEFPEVMMEEVEGLKETEAIRTIVIEMAPIEWLPHAVFTVTRSFSHFPRFFRSTLMSNHALIISFSHHSLPAIHSLLIASHAVSFWRSCARTKEASSAATLHTCCRSVSNAPLLDFGLDVSVVAIAFISGATTPASILMVTVTAAAAAGACGIHTTSFLRLTNYQRPPSAPSSKEV